MRKTEKGIFSVSCGFDEWQNTWVKYLDLNRNYRNIFEKEYGKHPFVDKAMNAGRGLRMICEVVVSVIGHHIFWTQYQKFQAGRWI